jgi:hypothetical protein
MISNIIEGEVVHSDLKGAFVCSSRQLTPKEIKDGFKLLKKKENAIKEQGSVHYWNHWDIVYRHSVGRASQGWSIKCKHCAVHLGTSNTSASIQKHMTSRQKCPGSSAAWSEHVKEAKAALTPSQTEACGSIVQSSSKAAKRSFQPTIDFSANKSTVEKFVKALMKWAVLNSTSLSFRALDNPSMRSALKILGYNKGIDRKTIATTFLDTMYEDFKAKRSQSLKYFGQYQISADSWKYRIARRYF